MSFQWISWVSPPIYFAVCVTNFHLKKNMSLYIGAKFFRSETPQNIRYEHDEAAYLFTVTRHWLTECTPLRSPRRTFASANDKGRGILRSSSKRRQETTYVGPVKLGHFPFFHPHSLPTPTPYGSLSYVVFVVGTIEIQMSVFSENFGHLSVNPIQTLQNVVGVLKKDRGSLLLPIGGTGGEVEMECPILFSASHFLLRSNVAGNFITASRVNSRLIAHPRMQGWIWNLQLPTDSTFE